MGIFEENIEKHCGKIWRNDRIGYEKPKLPKKRKNSKRQQMRHHSVLEISSGPPTAESKNRKNHGYFKLCNLFFLVPQLFGPPKISLVPQLWLQRLAISRTRRHPLKQSAGSERQTTSPAEKPVQFLNLTYPAMAVPTSPWLYFLPAQRIFYAGWILFYAPLDCFCNDGSAIQVWVMKGRRNF